MPYGVTFKLEGLQQFAGALAALDDRTRRRVLQPAVRAGAQVVLAAVRKTCPVEVGTDELSRARAGLLKKSLGKVVRSYRGGDTVAGVVGPQTGFKRVVGTRRRGPNAGRPVTYDPARTAHLVELGHGGPHPAPAHPFLAPAVATSKAAAEAAVADKIRDGLEKFG